MTETSSRTTYVGTVLSYNKTKGFGFIKINEERENLFVHWADIFTDDPCPSLKVNTKLEFEIGRDKTGRTKALNVTLEGGDKVPNYSLIAPELINEDERFTGSIKRFRAKAGYGFITSDKEITWLDQTSKDIYFYRNGLPLKHKPGCSPKLDEGLRVSFKVCKGTETLNALDIRKEDGTPIELLRHSEGRFPDRMRRIEQEANFAGWSLEDLKKEFECEKKRLEERVLIEDARTWTGTLRAYSAEYKTGTIDLSEKISFERHSLMYFIHFDKRDSIFLSPDAIPQLDIEVIFNVYMSPKGLRACQVKHIDGSPLGSVIERKMPEDEEAKKRGRDQGEETQRENKKRKREIVNDGETYAGTLKRWSQKKELWIISLDDEIKYKEHLAKKKIYAYKGDFEDNLQPKTKVKFKVYISEKGLAAFEVRCVDDISIGSVEESSKSEDEVEHIDGTALGSIMNGSKSVDEEAKKLKSDEEEASQCGGKIKREVVNDGKIYTGMLKKWSQKKKLWVISIKDKIKYKEHHSERKIHAHKGDIDDNESLSPKSKVSFKVYLCERGLAAFEVRSAEETTVEGKKQLLMEKGE